MKTRRATYIGSPCKRGGHRLRYECDGACVECKREAGRKCYEKNSEKERERKQKWREENPEKVRERNRKYYAKNSEKWRERSQKYREENPEKVRESDRKYYAQNPEKKRELSQRRRARKLAATPPWADPIKTLKFYERCPKGMTVDHVAPFAHPLIVGLHWHKNFQYLTKSENCSKGNRLPPGMTPESAVKLGLAI
jgi:hypothetical protein